jgi:Protein of unknown function (DUF3096)
VLVPASLLQFGTAPTDGSLGSINILFGIRIQLGKPSMNLHLTIGPLVSLIAGILILVVPRLLNYIVAIYLIIIGLLGLFGSGTLHLH